MNVNRSENRAPCPRIQSHAALIKDYLAPRGVRPQHIENLALRSESMALRDALAYGAADGEHDYLSLAARLNIEGFRHFKPEWLAALARVCALQNLADNDKSLAIQLLSVANEVLPRTKAYRKYHKLEIELLIESGLVDSAISKLMLNPEIREVFYDYLYVDLKNAFVYPNQTDYGEWLSGFNAPFVSAGLHSLSIAHAPGAPLDRIQARVTPEPVNRGPLVSVIMTCFKPDLTTLLTSVRSITAQSWRNLELLIIDDASPTEYDETLEAASGLDSRIKLVRQKQNAGTYVARNTGISIALGDFVTGQDSDDWSHPERIQRQVEKLQDDASLSGVQAFAIKVTEDLNRTHTGFNTPFMESAPTLMVRTDLARDVGGYLPIRKAADNEFRRRIERYSGQPVDLMRDPLILMRQLSDSLSRDDFRPGWQHEARRSFKRTYTYWQDNCRQGDLNLRDQRNLPIAVPPRLSSDPSAAFNIDVLFVNDWSQLRQSQSAMLEEIRVLTEAGQSVGIMHWERPVFVRPALEGLCREVQDLISRRVVTEITRDAVGSVRLAIIREPAILQFVSVSPSGFSTDAVAIVVDAPAVLNNGESISYLPHDCDSHALSIFGKRPVWIAQDRAIHEAMEVSHFSCTIWPDQYAGVVEVKRDLSPRQMPSGPRPVIGRRTENQSYFWPDDVAEIDRVWPLDGELDARFIGSDDLSPWLLNQTSTPAGWIDFSHGDMSLEAFYNSIDFYVDFQHKQSPLLFTRGALEAMASGVPVISRHSSHTEVSDAVLYVEPYELHDVLADLFLNSQKYSAQVQRGLTAAREHFPPQQLLSLVAALVRYFELNQQEHTTA